MLQRDASVFPGGYHLLDADAPNNHSALMCMK